MIVVDRSLFFHVITDLASYVKTNPVGSHQSILDGHDRQDNDIVNKDNLSEVLCVKLSTAHHHEEHEAEDKD